MKDLVLSDRNVLKTHGNKVVVFYRNVVVVQKSANVSLKFAGC